MLINVNLAYGQDGLYRFRNEDNWGYKILAGKVKIEPVFKHASQFREGIALVQNSEGLYYYIDSTGGALYDQFFDEAYDFSEKRAIVSKNGKFGVIDEEGHFIIEPMYDDFYMNYKNGLIGGRLSEKHYLFDHSGEILFSSDDYVDFRSNQDTISFKENGLWGYKLRDGSTFMEPTFSSCTAFKNGSAAVKHAPTEDWRYISVTSELLFDEYFDYAGEWVGQYAIIGMDEKAGLINRDGAFIFTPVYYNIYIVSQNLLVAVDFYYQSTIIDSQGKILLEVGREIEEVFEGDGVVFYRTLIDGKNLLKGIDFSGKEIQFPLCDDLFKIDDNMWAISINNKIGVYSREFGWLVPAKYDYLRALGNGVVELFENGNEFKDENANIEYFKFDQSIYR